MKFLSERPSWDEAPEWATDLLRSDPNGYAWAEKVGVEYFSEPKPPQATWDRIQFLSIGSYWKVMESRPAAPAQRTTGEFVREQMQQYRAAQAAVERQPDAYAVFAEVDGKMVMQFPAHASREDAERDCKFFVPHAKTEVRALYAHPVQPLSPAEAEKLWLRVTDRWAVPKAAAMVLIRGTEEAHHIEVK